MENGKMEKNENGSELFFVTATICGWKPLFEYDPYVSILLQSLAYLRDHQRIKIFAYVIMPTHLHLVIQPIKLSIAKVKQEFGSYLSLSF
jgi:REP element-mobilizing transposase RayT